MFKESSKVLSDFFTLQTHESCGMLYHDFEKEQKWFFDGNTLRYKSIKSNLLPTEDGGDTLKVVCWHSLYRFVFVSSKELKAFWSKKGLLL